MSVPPAKRRKEQASKSWWSDRRNRIRLWVALLAGGVVAVGVLFWITSQSSSGITNEDTVPVGKQVDAVKLEDSRTGQTFDLGQYVGKRDTVIVAYMGEFCIGCSELVAELERRAPDFAAANANLAVLGYEIGETGSNTAAKHGITSYPLLQEGASHTFTRSIGMWSDMMDMPFMGYVIIDKSRKIVTGEQTGLSEARGAAPANVDKLLSALARAGSTRASSTSSSDGARLAAGW